MSRFKKVWAPVVLLAAALLAGTVAPVQAAPTQPAPPTPSDVCGVSQDQIYTPKGQSPSDSVIWEDSLGNSYTAGRWTPTGGASSISLTATVYGSGLPETYTYPPLTFGTEPDSSCVEALDTVTTRVVSCNTSNNGTVVEFTYTNTDDATNWSHTRPDLWVQRWDYGQSAYVVFTEGQVADGAQRSVSGGDTGPMGDGVQNHIFLAPGTYSMALGTNGSTDRRVLPNTLFVPACGTYTVPKGDPMGGPIPITGAQPRATISKCRAHRVQVSMYAGKLPATTRYTLVVNPRRGSTKRTTYDVGAQEVKDVTLKRQKSGTIVKATFAGKVVKRKLTC